MLHLHNHALHDQCSGILTKGILGNEGTSIKAIFIYSLRNTFIMVLEFIRTHLFQNTITYEEGFKRVSYTLLVS